MLSLWGVVPKYFSPPPIGQAYTSSFIYILIAQRMLTMNQSKADKLYPIVVIHLRRGPRERALQSTGSK